MLLVGDILFGRYVDNSPRFYVVIKANPQISKIKRIFYYVYRKPDHGLNACEDIYMPLPNSQSARIERVSLTHDNRLVVNGLEVKNWKNLPQYHYSPQLYPKHIFIEKSS